MITLNTLKKAAVHSLIAVSAFGAASAYAGSTDDQGFYKDKSCDELDVIQEGPIKSKGAVATGLKASNAAWDMELYANNKNGEWILVGKERGKKSDEVCILASGGKTIPYVKEKWYASYFQKGSPAQVATTGTGIKPHVN